MTDIQKYEELSMRAWPSSQTIEYDGWIIRLSNGITKRANSINTLYRSSINLDKKIEYCEHIYEKNHLPVVYKLTPSSISSQLDSALHDRGYTTVDTTSFQTLTIGNDYEATDNDIKISQIFSESWLRDFMILSNKNTKDFEGHKAIITAIDSTVAYISVKYGPKTIGCAMAVLEDDCMGLFDLVVSEEYRGLGYGRKMVNSILDWAKKAGAKEAYLQVTTQNKVALNLYEKMGFREVYRYWYRVKSL